jgi:glycosyltransferase involved in cell wall biosynthesis
MEPVRTTILTSIMAPHRISLFNALASFEDIDLSVIYLARSDPSRRWLDHEDEMRFRHRVLREHGRIRRGESYLHVTTGLIGALRATRPQAVIVGGWDQIAYHEARALCAVLDARILYWVESNDRDRRDDGPWLRRAKGRLLRGVDGVIVPGSASAAYVKALGADSGRVWFAPNAVDNDLFEQAAPDRATRTRPPRFLFVGRLESAKGVAALLDAWQRVDTEATLTLIGTGSLDAAVRRRLERSGLSRVELVEHLARDDLAVAYGDADVFVFPSVSDPWGLVLNEAMASGLPVIAASAAGAVDDLVIDGVNGIVVPPYDPGPLAAAIEALAVDRDRRLEMGARSRERIGRFRPHDWAAGMRDAILRTCLKAA